MPTLHDDTTMRRYGPNRATANMSSNTSPSDADVSAVDDQLASLQVSEGQANTKRSDTSTDGAAPQLGGGQRALDPELWKPHPPTEDCPVCFVPLPSLEEDKTYWVCCGRSICSACTFETLRAQTVIIAKRAKKKLAPLDLASCSFCRTASNDTESEYEKRIWKGDGQAAYSLALRYRCGDADKNIPKDEARFLEFIHNAADDLGYSAAMLELGRMYSDGVDGVPTDKGKGLKYLENAVKMGNVKARNSLACIEVESGNSKLAICHWKLAAAAGDEPSTKKLWRCFLKGALEKTELEETLRAHQEACDSMNSEERERYALWKKAEAVRDEMLTNPLRNYYAGIINAKDLNLALKALRKTDG